MKPITLIKVCLIAIGFTLSGCTSPTDITLLEGYWEIEKVDLPGGETKEYSISTTVDHYTLETDSTGFKTKVMPQLDGSFKTSGKREIFKLDRENGKLLLNFTTPLSEHRETILLLKEDQFILLNERDMKYTYKRFKKLNLE